MSNLPPIPDPHFGSDEEMLAWCERENLTPVKNERDEWDWIAVWEIYMTRPVDDDDERA